MLTLIAHLYARPDKRSDLEEILFSLVLPTRQEPGCVDYHLHQSDENQNHFMFYENWRDQDAFEEHLKMPYLVDFWERRLSYLERDIELKFFTMTSNHATI